jgi:hypothetical protein
MHKALTLALGLAAGLLGGMLTRYIAPPAAHAQDQAVSKEIRAQSFTLVDQFNHTAGTFSYESTASFHMLPRGQGPQSIGPGRIVLRDASGREIWSAGSRIVPVTER